MIFNVTAGKDDNNSHKALGVLHRVLLSLIGSYLFTCSFIAFAIAVLVALGVGFHEAEAALMMIGFLLFLPLFLWAFSMQKLLKVWLVLVSGSSFMVAIAWGLQQMILA